MSRLGDEVTSGGKLFQTLAPATWNARSPKVDSRRRGTSRSVDADERRVRPPKLERGVKMLMKYAGAEPCSDL